MSAAKVKALAIAIAAVALLLWLDSSALAQCSMCRAALGGSNNPFFIRNFNIGVLVLLLPPVTIFCSIFVVLKRHNKNGDGDEGEVLSAPEPVELPKTESKSSQD